MRAQLPTEVQEELARLDVHYDIGDELDKGANGYVFFAKNRITGREVALKFYPIEPDGTQHREPQLLAQLRSPNVLEILDARAIADEWAFFVTPKCDGGDLDDLIDRGVSALEAIDVIIGICRGVSDIHAQDLVHRDLKPKNIVMDGGVPKIADFGSVRLVPAGAEAVPASKHTIIYRAPESFIDGVHGKVGDVYQVGVVAYQLLGGTLSYNESDYLKPNERRQWEAMIDPIDRSMFVDEAIKKRITSRQLLKFDTLPPWARAADRVLRRMTSPDSAARFQSISLAATAFHALRARVRDWRRTPNGADLRAQGRTVELRAVNPGDLYEAYVDNGRGFRRAPIPRDSLARLVANF